MTLSAPRIVCAANRVHTKDGNTYLLIGARHWDQQMHSQMGIIKDKLVVEGFTGKLYSHNISVDQGFIDQHNNFYDRQEAYEIAEKNDQILRHVSEPGTLYSENLY